MWQDDVKYTCLTYIIMEKKQLKIRLLTVQCRFIKTSLKLLNIENRGKAARRVMFMAGSLRYSSIKRPLFIANSVECKNTPYGHCTHFSHVKSACLQYNVDLKKQLETLVY